MSNKDHTTALIEVTQASKHFNLGEVKVKALEQVSLKVASGGQIIALMGPSGSGKSTLLNMIGALDSVDEGSVIVAGKDLRTLNQNERSDFRNTTVGFVFQNFNLIPVLTTLENVLLPWQLSARPESHATSTQYANDLLEKVGLLAQAHQKVNRLSGGQMQRVAIARALMNKPKIILADEPTANLDHATSAMILELLKNLCKQKNVCVMMATHDHSVLPYCERIVSMRDGKIVSDEIK